VNARVGHPVWPPTSSNSETAIGMLKHMYGLPSSGRPSWIPIILFASLLLVIIVISRRTVLRAWISRMTRPDRKKYELVV
jgi:hypothetical protein